MPPSFVKAESGLAADAGAEIQSQAFSIAVLVHELSSRPILGRQQPAAHQPEAGCREIGHNERPAQALGEALHEVGLLAGIDLHRMANLYRECPVRGDRIGGDHPRDRPGR